MCEVERHNVELGAERRLEVAVPVEPFLQQLLVDRVDGLLLVRKLARERVHSPPLGGVEVGVERDEQRGGSGDDVSDGRAGIRRATAAREQQRDRTEKKGDPAG